LPGAFFRVERLRVRCADSEQDGAIFLTAAFTGLRIGELRAPVVGDTVSVDAERCLTQDQAVSGMKLTSLDAVSVQVAPIR
jgi:hypothetical protein